MCYTEQISLKRRKMCNCPFIHSVLYVSSAMQEKTLLIFFGQLNLLLFLPFHYIDVHSQSYLFIIVSCLIYLLGWVNSLFQLWSTDKPRWLAHPTVSKQVHFCSPNTTFFWRCQVQKWCSSSQEWNLGLFSLSSVSDPKNGKHWC